MKIAVGVRPAEEISRINSVFPLRMFLGEITKNFLLDQKGSATDVTNTSQTINLKWTVSVQRQESIQIPPNDPCALRFAQRFRFFPNKPPSSRKRDLKSAYFAKSVP